MTTEINLDPKIRFIVRPKLYKNISYKISTSPITKCMSLVTYSIHLNFYPLTMISPERFMLLFISQNSMVRPETRLTFRTDIARPEPHPQVYTA